MSRGKKDREEITNTEEVKETEVSDEMEKAEDSEKAEDDKKPEETKETDDKPVSLYVQEPFIDPSVNRMHTKVMAQCLPRLRMPRRIRKKKVEGLIIRWPPPFLRCQQVPARSRTGVLCALRVRGWLPCRQAHPK